MKLAVFFNLGGDIDVLSPFLSPFPGGEIKIIVSEKLLATNHRLSIVLDAYGLEPEEVLSHRSSRDELRNAISDCSHLLTSSESNLNPHRLAFALTQEANHLGLLTATLQHGVENIGLTYFDEYQGPEVRFASQQVLTWNGTRSLLPDVCSETREKVIDVGLPSARPDPAFDELFEAMEFNPEGRKVIGIFENLHWTRYSDDFRRKFLDDLQQATELFPDLLFVTKPHHEGRWLTERFQGDRPENSNLLIIDPKSHEWSLLTAPTLLPSMVGVITTPSKVALDASLAGLPVAIASYDGQYAYYNDLVSLSMSNDWFEFLRKVDAGPDDFGATQNEAFIGKTVSSVRAPQRVNDALLKKVSQSATISSSRPQQRKSLACENGG